MTTFTTNQRKNIVIAIALMSVLGLSAWISLNPGNYFFYSEEVRQHWTHPTRHFLVVCGCYIAEAIFVAKTITLEAGVRLWPRALAAMLLFLPWTVFSSMFVVHAPVYVHLHIVWVWLLLGTLALVALGSACRHAFGRFRRKPNAV